MTPNPRRKLPAQALFERYPALGSALRIALVAAASALLLTLQRAPGMTAAGAMALAAGATFLFTWRWWPASAGLALAGLLSVAPGPLRTMTWAAAAVGVGGLLVVSWIARQSRFDVRLQRGRDMLGLTACAAAWAALQTGITPGLGTMLGVDASAGGALAGGAVWAWLAALSLFLLAALPVCAWPQTDVAQWVRRKYSTAALALGLAAALLAPVGWSGWPGMTWLAPAAPVLTLALVARSGLAVTSLVLASTTLLVVLVGGSAAWPGQPTAHAAGMIASLFTAMLAHALGAEAAWREQRWEWALDGSRLGVADWHLNGSDAFVSAAWRTLSGHAEADWTPDGWAATAHSDDRAALQTAIAQVASGEVGRVRLELRMPDGQGWHWLEATLLVIERESAGRPVRLLATLSDVDERHEAQERQRLSASLFQHLHEGLLITDPELRVLDANPAYAEILGVPREEMLGQVPSLLRPTPADPLARQQRAGMWAGLRNNGSWRGELLERRRNGEMCTLQVTMSSVLGPQGDTRYHVLVISDITEQRVQRERLERQAHYDELTRLPNRAHLSQLLTDAMRAADRDGYLLVVCYLDLDRFKPVNDRYGHAAGDRLLIELSGRLRSALRTRETWADTAARLGGDEFVLLLRAGTIEEARMAVERVLRVVSQPYLVDPAEEAVQITASMGATVYPIDRSDADTLLRHADHAMYGAKQSGRNGYLFFDPEHRRRTEERVMAIGRVQEALDLGEFVLFYQPKVDMRSGEVLGFEALLRWDHPQHGLIAPMQFLPLIENTGLSARVGDWVFAQALDHLSSWRRAGLDISVSVNVAARHLQEPDFAQRLSELLARHAQPLASHFELEVLETAAHADIEATSALLARCRTLGVRFALDDFGTGYSTLTYLKRLPVDVLKIDRSFVHHMLDDAQDRAIVEGVIGLARTFGCTVVAEGVESPAQARTLLDLGCDIGQGTGIAAPMPAGQVAAWAAAYRGMFALSTAAAAALPGAAGSTAT